MKSEKGVTLTSLVIYIVVFVIILTIMSTISAHFYKNVGLVKESPEYITEFNKFIMFFITDTKRNTSVTSVTTDKLIFADGTTYEYISDTIYRDNELIAKNVKEFAFNSKSYIENDFTKQIINVTTKFGTNNSEVSRDIDFVLKYW